MQYSESQGDYAAIDVGFGDEVIQVVGHRPPQGSADHDHFMLYAQNRGMGIRTETLYHLRHLRDALNTVLRFFGEET